MTTRELLRAIAARLSARAKWEGDLELADGARTLANRLDAEMERLGRIRDNPLAGEMWTEGAWNRLDALTKLDAPLGEPKP